MATTAPPPNTSSARSAGQPLLFPPDDTIWKRYSPHHEAPLSFVGSFAVHALVLGLLVVYVILFILWLGGSAKPLPISTIRMPGGGGGNPKGQGNGPGVGLPGEVVSDPMGDPMPVDGDLVQRPPLDVQEARAAKVEFGPDPEAMRFIESGNENMKMLARLDKEVRDRLRDGVNPGKGKGGDGQGGGKGIGDGPGDGPGKGDGKLLNDREKRMLRWSMTFDTRSGQDYLEQLRDLGATLAIPSGNDGKEYKVVDLSKQPYRLESRDLSDIKQIYWVDDKPGSVRSLMTALGVQSFPSHFVAFMPVELEDRLFKMELMHQGLKESQIDETKFKCVKGAGGKYGVIVTAQTRK